jgi:hypothetical protein
MCGWIFCAGCVSLADHDPRCHVCLSIDSDPDIDDESQPGAAEDDYEYDGTPNPNQKARRRYQRERDNAAGITECDNCHDSRSDTYCGGCGKWLCYECDSSPEHAEYHGV